MLAFSKNGKTTSPTSSHYVSKHKKKKKKNQNQLINLFRVFYSPPLIRSEAAVGEIFIRISHSERFWYSQSWGYCDIAAGQMRPLQVQLSPSPRVIMMSSRSLSSCLSCSLCSSSRDTRESLCSTTSSISSRIRRSSTSCHSSFRWSTRRPGKTRTDRDEPGQTGLILTIPVHILQTVPLMMSVCEVTVHGHPLSQLLLQSTLSVLQFQLPSTKTQ